jgi:hypothetical protein
MVHTAKFETLVEKIGSVADSFRTRIAVSKIESFLREAFIISRR